MKKIGIAALIGAIAGVVLFAIVWLVCSFIALEWVEPYWALLRGAIGIFAFASAGAAACLELLDSDW